MAYNHTIPTFFRYSADFDMNFGHQRASCIKNPQIALLGLGFYLWVDPMSRINQHRLFRNLLDIFDKFHALFFEFVDYFKIMHYLVLDKNRRTKNSQYLVDYFQGSIHTSTKPKWPCDKQSRLGGGLV